MWEPNTYPSLLDKWLRAILLVSSAAIGILLIWLAVYSLEQIVNLVGSWQ